MAEMSIWTNKPHSKVEEIEFYPKRCGILGKRWIKVDLSKNEILLTISSDQSPISEMLVSDSIYAYKDRLYLQIDGGPEFEIDDIRVPGHKSYQEAMKESHLCPNHS